MLNTRIIISYFLIISLVTFLVYWHDKYKAKTGKWRTNEASLHLLALLGGWPGALLARQLFRHKTQKQPFVVIFYITIVFNITAICLFVFRHYIGF
ncbi:DUF1294 domain-containing protein [Thalassotalea sp. HSM 43]|nr:DUF1294 domain-containing protein [Thalassotalea sp. HSM 43]